MAASFVPSMPQLERNCEMILLVKVFGVVSINQLMQDKVAQLSTAQYSTGHAILLKLNRF